MKDKKPFNDEGLSKIYREIGPYIGLGMQLAVTVGIMVFIGIWLDGRFETTPMLTVIFAFLGVFIGMYAFIKTVMKSGK
ncbi:MAG: AtpZ/AtpI family protein [Ignavibacteriaceae bacterium]